MATAVHERVGVMDCMGCGKEIPVKKTKHGTLTAPCPWCDFKNYAQKGTEHYKNLHAKVRLDKPADDAPPAPAAKPPAEPPKPAAGKLPWVR